MTIPITAKMVETRARRYAVAKQRQEAKSKKPSKWTSVAWESVRTTRAMAINGPRNAVFETAEILEQIFIHLPLESLWKCQRVCKQFQAMTKTSPTLQEIMMLRPRQAPRECWKLKTPRNDFAQGAEEHFTAVDPTEVIPEPGSVRRKKLWTPARLCPLLKVYRSRHHPSQKYSAVRRDWNGYGSAELIVFNCSPNILSSCGAFKDLLVADPPCFHTRVDLRFTVGHYGIPDATLKFRRHVHNPDGLRFGDLIWGALKMPGDVHWSLNGREYFRKDKTPEKVLSRLEKRLGVRAILKEDRFGIWNRAQLGGMVIPTEEEWELVSGGNFSS